ncbi:protein FLOURY 1-like isoform X1 [Manihot esculenta]|nr:protein FLOURY 1-like isoform X1 [Manihot esculenta]
MCAHCLLALIWKLLNRSSELKGGFLVLGCFSPASNVFGLLLMFGLGLKLLQFTWQGKDFIQFLCEIRRKPGDKKYGFCSKKGLDKVCNSKTMTCKSSSLKLLVSNEPLEPDTVALDDDDYGRECDDDYGRKYCIEDEEFDVISLRRLVKIERYRAEMAYAELEKERMASESAAGEAMTMILRLQNEKSSLQIEANQQRRLVEQKEEYYQQMIQSLQWNLMKYMEGDEVDQFQGSYASLSFDIDSTMEVGTEDVQTDAVE